MNVELKVGHVTLYAQLARIFRDQIYNGTFKEGDEIPTLDQLSSQYNVARITVRQAIQILSQEGLLSSQRGRRTFVSYKAPSANVGPLYSSVGSIDSDPKALSIRILEKRRVDSLPLNLENEGAVSSDEYVLVRKVDSENDVPYVFSSSFIALSIFRRFPRGSEKKVKLFRLVRDHAEISPLHATERIKTSLPDPEEAEMLRIPSSTPVAKVTRFITGPGNELLFYGVHVYRGDLFCIERDISYSLVRTI